MPTNTVDDHLKQEIWKRDDFTCGLCGKMVPWEEVMVVHRKHLKGKKMEDPENLITVCAYCVEETKRAPPGEKDKRRLKMLLRELMAYTSYSEDVVFEEDYEGEVIKLSEKIEGMRKDIKLLTDAVQEKEKLAIAYKVKMDRALKDLENNKKRTGAEINLQVMDRTKALYMDMILIIDNLDRAIIEARKDESVREVKNVISGLIFIRKGTIATMERNGVKVIDPVGEAFNPYEHESIGFVDDAEKFKDTVVQVDMVGFKLDDMILRPAKVLISRGGPKRPLEAREEEIEEFELEGEEELEEMQDAGCVVKLGDGTCTDEEGNLIIRTSRKSPK
jgi:molecular chaperone GrpE